ncbi:hypothetical protein DFH11DRAFT_189279 [Phellopilus nigrolimitatus]|nr:hypothetical protein DFH11DRAFT_189279 [Phellopilus nigrolimitatus]
MDCAHSSRVKTVICRTSSMQSTTLAIGTLSRRLHIYDAHTLQVLRTYLQAHAQRIGVLAWNAHILSSGSRDRMVHQWDVRESGTMPFRQCVGHRQEVWAQVERQRSAERNAREREREFVKWREGDHCLCHRRECR